MFVQISAAYLNGPVMLIQSKIIIKCSRNHICIVCPYSVCVFKQSGSLDVLRHLCMSGSQESKQAACGSQDCLIALRNDSLTQESAWHAIFLHPHIRAKQSTSSRVNTKAQGAWQDQQREPWKGGEGKAFSAVFITRSNGKSAAQLPYCPSTTRSSSRASTFLERPCLFSSTPSSWRSYLTAVNRHKTMYWRLNKKIN